MWEVLGSGEEMHLSHYCPTAETTNPAHKGPLELSLQLSGPFLRFPVPKDAVSLSPRLSGGEHGLFGDKGGGSFNVVSERTWSSSISICMTLKPPSIPDILLPYGNCKTPFYCKVGFCHCKDRQKISFKLFCAHLGKGLCVSCWKALGERTREIMEDSSAKQHCRLSTLLKCPCRHYAAVPKPSEGVPRCPSLTCCNGEALKHAVSPEIQVVFVTLACRGSSSNSAV